MLSACPACGCYCRVTEAACPHCSAPFSPAGARRAATVVLMGLVLVAGPGCDGPTAIYGVPDTSAQAEYGVADTGRFEDDDGDGWTEAEGDCNDADATIHPDAVETAGDAIDSNCDGRDDP
jgi:hypothetical protein